MHGSHSPVGAGSFVAMWIVMMAAMMLPSLAAMLFRYRRAVVPTGVARLNLLTGLVGAGYLLIWAAIGMAVFPLGAAWTSIEAREPAVERAIPIAAALVVLVAGAVQFTAWKTHHLTWCREAPERSRTLAPTAGSAVRHGLGLGIHCVSACANLTAILLVMGMMESGVMAVVTAAITVERLAPAGVRMAYAVGVVCVATGLFLIARTGLSL